MSDNTPDPANLSKQEWRDLSLTMSAPQAGPDEMLSRLDYVSELLADAGKLPTEPVLVWRGADGAVRHKAIGSQLAVGRHADCADIAVPKDHLLSRRHFEVRVIGDTCELRDLESRNGTAINTPRNRVKSKLLRDGDLILAGKEVFAFLDQRLDR